jgi:hypothetical protein
VKGGLDQGKIIHERALNPRERDENHRNIRNHRKERFGARARMFEQSSSGAGASSLLGGHIVNDTSAPVCLNIWETA